MYLQCYTQQQIADELNEPQQTINDKIADLTEMRKDSEIGNFGDFEKESSTRQVYNIWNFAKATN